MKVSVTTWRKVINSKHQKFLLRLERADLWEFRGFREGWTGPVDPGFCQRGPDMASANPYWEYEGSALQWGPGAKPAGIDAKRGAEVGSASRDPPMGRLRPQKPDMCCGRHQNVEHLCVFFPQPILQHQMQ
jgi:hypothetical protein